MTERARTLTENRGRGDSIALTKRLLIAARRLCRSGLALSGALRQLSQRESLSEVNIYIEGVGIMKAFITVIGHDTVGVVARVSGR